MEYEKNNQQQYCVITEQGDLGLGADVLNEQDQKYVEESCKKEKENNK